MSRLSGAGEKLLKEWYLVEYQLNVVHSVLLKHVVANQLDIILPVIDGYPDIPYNFTKINFSIFIFFFFLLVILPNCPLPFIFPIKLCIYF